MPSLTCNVSFRLVPTVHGCFWLARGFFAGSRNCKDDRSKSHFPSIRHSISVLPVYGLGADATRDQLERELRQALQQWQERAYDPLAKRNARDVARVVVRSCEGMFERLEPVG